nr:DUF2243 domain-containing protein [Actinoplanes atraurantiacus]
MTSTGRYPADTVDGLFHTFTWLAVLTGIGLLYSRVNSNRGRAWASRALWGWLLRRDAPPLE